MLTSAEKETIRHNIEELKARAAAAAIRSGRSPDEVRIVLATKTRTAEEINYAVSCGITAVGENRVQELLDKYEGIDRSRTELHFIGTLQTNKVKYIIDKVDMIHSVNSLHLAEEIERQAAKAGRVMDVLLEVNAAGEASKTGIPVDELYSLLPALSSMKHLRVRGLMAIPPAPEKTHAEATVTDDKLPAATSECVESVNKVQINIETREYFRKIVEIFLDISAKKIDNIYMDILSLGMSGDYVEAIEEGSTLIRPGRAVFGERRTPPRTI